MSLLAILLQTTEQLVGMIESENALFGRAAPSELARTLAKSEPEKRRLVLAYERGMQALRGQKVPPSPERDRLRELVERFLALMEEHRRKLSAVRQVTERLVKAIGDAAQGPTKPVQTYTAHAVMRPAFRAKPISAPLALNRTI